MIDRLTIGDWILACGLGLYVCASVLSVVEEWPKQGLTDTSYPALSLWMLGSVLMAVWGLVFAHPTILYVASASIAATSVGLVLKLKDTKNYRRHR